jgi:hypothetical protein
MIRSIVDHVADRWFLIDDRREQFKVELERVLADSMPRELHVGTAVGKSVISRPLVDAARAVGIQRQYIGLSFAFIPAGVFKPNVAMRIKTKRVMVRHFGGCKGVHWLELYPYRDPELK